ncbi:hypothetical protein [Sphingopyxis chilensis]|uniref:hypothetical protein n=1 Tax=Sphingopyxis chilensis TaxID=180400 RepID=UPI002DDD53E7|nr:hypothetical protein [Sphingopyxis chilensis]
MASLLPVPPDLGDPAAGPVAVPRRTYTLRYDDDGAGVGKRVEFEAENAGYALEIARGEAEGRRALLLENGRALCRLEKAWDGDAPYWIVAAEPAPVGSGLEIDGAAPVDGRIGVGEASYSARQRGAQMPEATS